MKHTTVDASQLKAAVDAIKERKLPEVHQLRLTQQAKIAKLRRKLGHEVQPLFAGAGFDIGKIDNVLAHHRAEVRNILKKESEDATKRSGAIVRSRQLGIANTRQALEHLRFKPYVTTPIPVDTPFLIYATPVGMLHDSHIEPWNNWAKFTYSENKKDSSNSVAVNFYYAWQNPSAYLAVINCNTELLLNGIIEASAEQGWLAPGTSLLNLWAKLTVFVGQTEINWQGIQQVQIGEVYAEGGWAPIGGAGDLQAESVYGAYHLSCNDIQVQGNQVVVFEVACSANWWIGEGGSIVLDFDFDPGAYRVACPVLNVDLLTEPQPL